jgi:hypothetical protein
MASSRKKRRLSSKRFAQGWEKAAPLHKAKQQAAPKAKGAKADEMEPTNRKV